MDPQQKQDVKYKTQSIMGSLSDKMDIASTKFRNDEGSKLDVAVLKATLNDEVVPKEKHVVTLKIACGSGHQSVQYVIHRCEGGPPCGVAPPAVTHVISLRHACKLSCPRSPCMHAPFCVLARLVGHA